jgi:hypothetical protein
MKDLLKKGNKIEVTEEVQFLTKRYIEENIIPEKYANDAELLGLTTAYSLDILLS